MPKILDGTKQTLVSGYGTGLTNNQKFSRAWVSKPEILSTETIIAGNGASNATLLSPTATVSLVSTKSSATHVTLGVGIEGQTKIIIHKARAGSNDLVITPENGIGGDSIFANGDTITSNSANRAIQLMFDGSEWQVIAGEITGTSEMAIA